MSLLLREICKRAKHPCRLRREEGGGAACRAGEGYANAQALAYFAENFLKLKSAPTEADAQKTQTPIVAKQTEVTDRGYQPFVSIITNRLTKLAFLSNPSICNYCTLRGRIIPPTKKAPCYHPYSICLAGLLYHGLTHLSMPN